MARFNLYHNGKKGEEYKKNYCVENYTHTVVIIRGGSSALVRFPLAHNESLKLTSLQIRRALCPAEWFISAGLVLPFSSQENFGAEMGQVLAGCYYICKEIYDANSCSDLGRTYKHKKYSLKDKIAPDFGTMSPTQRTHKIKLTMRKNELCLLLKMHPKTKDYICIQYQKGKKQRVSFAQKKGGIKSGMDVKF